MAFLESTYRAAADLGGWDRGALECAMGIRVDLGHVTRAGSEEGPQLRPRSVGGVG